MLVVNDPLVSEISGVLRYPDLGGAAVPVTAPGGLLVARATDPEELVVGLGIGVPVFGRVGEDVVGGDVAATASDVVLAVAGDPHLVVVGGAERPQPDEVAAEAGAAVTTAIVSAAAPPRTPAAMRGSRRGVGEVSVMSSPGVGQN